MQSDIKYLFDGDYKTAKGKSVELIDKRIDSINQSFAFIHQATGLPPIFGPVSKLVRTVFMKPSAFPLTQA